MSNSDSENTEKDDKSSKSKKFRPKKMDKIKEMQQEHLYDYIACLHGLIEKHEKKLKKYKDKIRKLLQQIGCIKDVHVKEKTSPPELPQIETATNCTEIKADTNEAEKLRLATTAATNAAPLPEPSSDSIRSK